jgi:hypothetical protein
MYYYNDHNEEDRYSDGSGGSSTVIYGTDDDDDNDTRSTNSVSSGTSGSSIDGDFDFSILSIDGDFEYDDADQENTITEHIGTLETDYLDTDKTTDQYIIGMAHKQKGHYMLASCISPATYFKYNHEEIKKYLFMSSIYYLRRPKIDILQLHITPEGLYTCVIKTYWIKIIQRRWRTIYARRKLFKSLRCSVVELRYRELHSGFSQRCAVMPGLFRMFC